jgi:hypothetical protein
MFRLIYRESIDRSLYMIYYLNGHGQSLSIYSFERGDISSDDENVYIPIQPVPVVVDYRSVIRETFL